MKNLIKAVLILASGAGAARLVGILSIPVLTRLYPPEHFGVLAVYAAVLQILVPISSLRYIMAIPLPRQDRSAFALMVLSTVSAFVFTAILVISYLIIGEFALNLLSLEVLLPYVWLVPIGVLGASLYEALLMWGTRRRAYRTIARTQVWQAVSGEGVKLLLGVLMGRPIGLLIGHMVGQAGGLRYLISHFRLEFKYMAPSFRWIHLYVVAKKFRGFPIYRMPAQIILALAMQAPLLLTEVYYDTRTTGQMGLAMIAYTLPFALIGQAASRAYFAETAHLRADDAAKIMRVLKSTTITLGLFAIPVAVALHFFSEAGAIIVLGEEWSQSGRFVALLSIALVPQFVSATVIRTFDVLNAHRIVLVLHMTRLILVSFAFIISARSGASAEQSVLVFSLTLALHYMIQTVIIFGVVRHLKGAHS